MADIPRSTKFECYVVLLRLIVKFVTSISVILLVNNLVSLMDVSTHVIIERGFKKHEPIFNRKKKEIVPLITKSLLQFE